MSGNDYTYVLPNQNTDLLFEVLVKFPGFEIGMMILLCFCLELENENMVEAGMKIDPEACPWLL